MENITPVILCGGSGKRLHPLSSSDNPKQFLPLFSEDSLLQETISRILGIFNDPIIICNENHLAKTIKQTQNHNLESIIIEPENEGRNSAPALALASFHLQRTSPDSLILALPSDHIIKKPDYFNQLVKSATKLAHKNIVTFGINPDSPCETGYGYISFDKNTGKIESFIEKPSNKKAAEYTKQGFLWNSGIFLFSTSVYLSELQKYSPKIYNSCKSAFEESTKNKNHIYPDKESFVNCPSDSIDYAVMEHTNKAYVIPSDIGWSDIGSWKKVWENSAKDSHGNHSPANTQLIDSKNNYINSTSCNISLIGLENVAIIEKNGEILVINMDKSEQVKQIAQSYRCYYESPIGTLQIITSDSAITSISFLEENHPKYDEKTCSFTKEVTKQLGEYFAGERKEFNLSVDLGGTDFQKNVWEKLRQVPFGTTASYKDIAIKINNKNAFRAIGNANNKNVIPLIIPCHRIIGSNNKLVGYAGGLWRKKWLIEHESRIYGN